MARGDLLKKLLRGFKSSDQAAVFEAAREIIEDERKKHHTVLAQELSKILDNGHAPARSVAAAVFEPLPKDSDRGVPLIEVRQPDTFFADLVQSPEQHAILTELVQEYRHGEVLEANALRARTKLLFCGPPGCGKTVTAEALANELGLPLLYVKFDSVVSSLLGETAANLRRVFDYAARGMGVLFFDEFDAVGRSRDDASEHGELKRVVNAFLQMLDRFQGRSLVIAATNFEQSLDPALWRRFDEIVRFELPDARQIGLLLQKLLAAYPHPTLTDERVTDGFAGASFADVERVCMDLLRHAVIAGEPSIDRAGLDRALARHDRRKTALARSRGRNPLAEEEVNARAGLERQCTACVPSSRRIEWKETRVNGRLITSLIDHGRFGEARREYRAAQERLDLDGEPLDRTLAEQFHSWIVRAWLGAGQIDDACEVFEALAAAGVVSGSPILAELAAELADAREVEALGESVYPRWFPIERRWRGPQVQAEGDLREWFPGRVIEADSYKVRIVYAVPSDPEASRRVLLTEITAADWTDCGWGSPSGASGFVELHVYSDGGRRVFRIPEFPAPSRPESATTAWESLKKWASR